MAGLHGGAFGEVATYLPGRRVRGVRVADTAVEVHVVGRYPATVAEIAVEVRAAVATVAGARPVDVTIADLALAGEPDPDDAIVLDPPRPAVSPTPARGATTTDGPRAGAPTFPPRSTP